MWRGCGEKWTTASTRNWSTQCAGSDLWYGRTPTDGPLAQTHSYAADGVVHLRARRPSGVLQRGHVGPAGGAAEAAIERARHRRSGDGRRLALFRNGWKSWPSRRLSQPFRIQTGAGTAAGDFVAGWSGLIPERPAG